jgi:hypothetical protein
VPVVRKVFSAIGEGNPRSPNLMPSLVAPAICVRPFVQHQVNREGSRSTQSNDCHVTVPPQTLILRPILKDTAKRGIFPPCCYCRCSLTLVTHLHQPAVSTPNGLFICHWVKLLSCDNEVMCSNTKNSLLQKKCREMLHTKETR